ncbi:unnamed protein product [Calicophoron daubneyi]|uniref:BRCT domain-containing protein n=1 Tax=Calicophoron daubneyi TaxID=300641 RepID=A0AAV2TFV9_CALDB
MGSTGISPLRGVVAYIDVKSSFGNPALAISSRLARLGAHVSMSLNSSVTHIIFRNGSDETKCLAKKRGLFLVSPAWVKYCYLQQFRVRESAFPVVDKEDVEPLDPTQQPSKSPDCSLESNLTGKLENAIVDWRMKSILMNGSLDVTSGIRNFADYSKDHNKHDIGGKDPLSRSRIKKPPPKSIESSVSLASSPKRFDPTQVTPTTSTQREFAAHITSDVSVIISPLKLPTTISCESDCEISVTRPLVKQVACKMPEGNYAIAHRLAPLNRLNTRGSLLPTADSKLTSKPANPDHLLPLPKHLSPRTPLTPDLLVNLVNSMRTPKSRGVHKPTNTASSHRMVEKKKVIRLKMRKTPKHKNSQSLAGGPKKSSRSSPEGDIICSKAAAENSLPAKSLEHRKRRAVAGQRRNRLPTLVGPSKVDLDESGDKLISKALTANSKASSGLNTSSFRNNTSLLKNAIKSQVPTPAIPTQCVKTMSGKTHRKLASPKHVQRPVETHSVFGTSSSLSHPHTQNDSGRPRKVQRDSILKSIQPLTSRNSLDEFDLRNVRGKLLHSSLRADTVDNYVDDSSHPKVVIAFTGLLREDEAVLRALLQSSSLQNYELSQYHFSVRETRSSYVKNKSAKCFTHLITSNPYRRTLTLFRGLLSGAYVVSTSWLEESARCGMWLPEGEFKVRGLPKKTNVSYFELFSSVGPIFVGPVREPPRSDLVELLELGGATIVNRPSSASVLIGAGACQSTKPSWVLDSIIRAKLLSTDQYKSIS